MILFTKLEIRILDKKDKEDDNELSHLQRSVLRELMGEEDGKSDDEEYTMGVADAIIDTDNKLVFYEYDGVTMIETLGDSPVILSHGLEPIKDAYEQLLGTQLSKSEENLVDSEKLKEEQKGNS